VICASKASAFDPKQICQPSRNGGLVHFQIGGKEGPPNTTGRTFATLSPSTRSSTGRLDRKQRGGFAFRDDEFSHLAISRASVASAFDPFRTCVVSAFDPFRTLGKC
jgi:hypothetical protein